MKLFILLKFHFEVLNIVASSLPMTTVSFFKLVHIFLITFAAFVHLFLYFKTLSNPKVI